MAVRAALVWFALLAVAVTSGTVRSLILEPILGEHSAHMIGTLVVVCIFIALIGGTVRWIDPVLSVRNLFGIGLAWTVATVAFEFLFGHYTAGHSWDALLDDYNIARGRLWILVPATLFASPPVFGSLRRRNHKAKRFY